MDAKVTRLGKEKKDLTAQMADIDNAQINTDLTRHTQPFAAKKKANLIEQERPLSQGDHTESFHEELVDKVPSLKEETKVGKKGRLMKSKSDEAILKTLKNLSKDSQEAERRSRELSHIQEESQQQLLTLLQEWYERDQPNL